VVDEKTESYVKSNFYEQLVEHVFISEVLQEAWFKFNQCIEVLHSEIDSSGYDLVLECNGIIRHIQLKTSIEGAKRSTVNINVALAEKPSGCVVWTTRHIDKEKNRISLEYLFFGGNPGEVLPGIDNLRITKHTKGNSLGIKKERPSIREIPKSRFMKIKDTSELLSRLFNLTHS
jgi:hypothetical protein